VRAIAPVSSLQEPRFEVDAAGRLPADLCPIRRLRPLGNRDLQRRSGRTRFLRHKDKRALYPARRESYTQTTRPAPAAFFIRRFFRIYPPYLLAVLFLALVFPLTRLPLNKLSDWVQIYEGLHT
jgi:hypothetical protein